MKNILNYVQNRYFLTFCTGFLSALTCVTLWRSLNYSPTTISQRKRVVFFGDSITQHGFNVDIKGWVAQLAHWWTRRIDVVNRGFSGYNSRWGKLIVEDVVNRENPDFVFIFFGANDAVDESVLQHVPLQEYEENMREIIVKIKQVI
jgi:lysophospholipase L1-like esterase